MASPPNESKVFLDSSSRQRTESLRSTDSENLAGSPPERRFSLSQMLGRRTSVGEAYKKYAGFTVNGDGFDREDYRKSVDPKEHYGLDEHGHTVDKHNQGYFLP